jgi:Mrp family chromosome partitioning ATPase
VSQQIQGIAPPAPVAARPSFGRSVFQSRDSANLFYNITSLRVQSDPIALQFVAARPGEGTSLIASRFAAFAAEVEGSSALLIDCTVRQPRKQRGRRPAAEDAEPPSLLDAYMRDGKIDGAITPHEPNGALSTARLTSRGNSLLHSNAETLSAVLGQVRKRYRLAVLDTPSLEETTATLVFSRACDGVVLVLEGEATPARAAEATIEAVERSGGKILGIVYNKRRMHMPSWLYRRL